MSSNPWFRLYAEFASDPVIQSLSHQDQRHFVVLLCLKCAGTLDREIDKRVRNRITVRTLGLDASTASEVKRRLQKVGIIDGNWQPIAWETRQFKSDSSSARVRKYRKSKETGNGHETLLKRTRNRDRVSPPYPPSRGADALKRTGRVSSGNAVQIGKQLGMPARVGETMETYVARLKAHQETGPE